MLAREQIQRDEVGRRGCDRLAYSSSRRIDLARSSLYIIQSGISEAFEFGYLVRSEFLSE
jgi:hypothetical protein